jgi:hypothetical protein
MNYHWSTIEAIKKRFRGSIPTFFIENPESYLGPNFATVINFWSFHDSLNYSQYLQVSSRWVKIMDKNVTLECNAYLNEIKSPIVCASLYWSFNSEQETTEEIILLHKLLKDRNYEMQFVKMYDNL